MKFRVWDSLLKEFRERDFYLDCSGDLRLKSDLSIRIAKSSFFIQFCTGLIDKNGVEIYEGDIVISNPSHLFYTLGKFGISEFQKAEVRYFNEAFHLLGTPEGPRLISEYAMCNCCPCGLEVVGNIFE